MLSPQQARQLYEESRPDCPCGEPARLQQSKRENGNMNRRAVLCPGGSAAACMYREDLSPFNTPVCRAHADHNSVLKNAIVPTA